MRYESEMERRERYSYIQSPIYSLVMETLSANTYPFWLNTDIVFSEIVQLGVVCVGVDQPGQRTQHGEDVTK